MPIVMQVRFKLLLSREFVLLVQQELFQRMPEHLLAGHVLWVEFPPESHCQRVRSAQAQAMLQQQGRQFVFRVMQDLLA